MSIKELEGKPLRNMKFARAAVTDINHVAFVPEVQHALTQWIKAKTGTVAPGVLIGGLAMSFYSKPRYTQDVDLLFLTPSQIPTEVIGFKPHRKGAFEEYDTQVEVEVNTSASFKTLPHSIVTKVIDTAVDHGGIRVASLEGLIALKLCASESEGRKFKDLADIETLVEANPAVTMEGWSLPEHLIKIFNEIKSHT
jgi:hypothetical protein